MDGLGAKRCRGSRVKPGMTWEWVAAVVRPTKKPGIAGLFASLRVHASQCSFFSDLGDRLVDQGAAARAVDLAADDLGGRRGRHVHRLAPHFGEGLRLGLGDLFQRGLFAPRQVLFQLLGRHP